MITITVDTMTAALENVKAAITGQPIMTSIANIALRDIIQHFRERRGPDGQWPPLAEITIQKRRNHSDVPLQDTRQLLQSGHIEATSQNAAVIFSKFDYRTHTNVAKLMNDGGRGIIIEDGHRIEIEVPARPFMWLSDEAINEITYMVQERAA